MGPGTGVRAWNGPALCHSGARRLRVSVQVRSAGGTEAAGKGGIIVPLHAGAPGPDSPRKTMKLAHLLAASLCLSLTAAPALAQTAAPAKPAPAKPAPKPPAKPAPAAPEGRTATLTGNAAGGPIMTRDELRVCLSREEQLRTRLAENDQRRATLDQEKQQITADQEKLKAERAGLQSNARAEEMNARTRAYAARVEAWNKKAAEFQASTRKDATSERIRTQINEERVALEVEQKQLEADRAKVEVEMKAAIDAYNAKAGALDARVQDWNGRNAPANEAGKALEAERAAWVSECGGRRYREDDETAIRRGK